MLRQMYAASRIGHFSSHINWEEKMFVNIFPNSVYLPQDAGGKEGELEVDSI